MDGHSEFPPSWLFSGTLLWSSGYEFFCERVFSVPGCICRSRIAGPRDNFTLTRPRDCGTEAAAPRSTPLRCPNAHVLPSPPPATVRSFNIISSSGREAVSRGFELHFPNDWWHWASSHVLIGYFYIFFDTKKVYSHPLLVYLSFCCWFVRLLYLIWMEALHKIYDLLTFSPILWVVFSLWWYPSGSTIFNFDKIQFIYFSFCHSCFWCHS